MALALGTALVGTSILFPLTDCLCPWLGSEEIETPSDHRDLNSPQAPAVQTTTSSSLTLWYRGLPEQTLPPLWGGVPKPGQAHRAKYSR